MHAHLEKALPRRGAETCLLRRVDALEAEALPDSRQVQKAVPLPVTSHEALPRGRPLSQ
jgi:hypothetical protein